MKYILLIFILFSSAALASDPQQNTYNTHKTHSYVGFHGMALILAGDKLLASHMPLYALLKKQTQITILPTKFDLNLLINKLTPTLNTTVFNGHFERGGTALFSTKLTFKNPLYVKKIAITQPEKEEFDLIKVSAEQGVIIHKIQSRPSYDSLSLVALTNGKYNGQLKCDAPVTTTLASKLKACFKSVPSYLETHDFAVN